MSGKGIKTEILKVFVILVVILVIVSAVAASIEVLTTAIID